MPAGLDAIPGEAAFPRLPKKDRWAPAAKLRVLVPAPWCEALVQPCLELMTPPASGTGLEECLLTAPGAVQTPAAMPGSQQTSASQQQQQATQNPGKRAKVWQKRECQGEGGGILQLWAVPAYVPSPTFTADRVCFV
jgi:hypothetical protein